jgi:hypothetical protein
VRRGVGLLFCLSKAEFNSSENDALSNTTPLQWTVSGNSSFTSSEDLYTRFGGRFVVISGHSSNVSLRGIYVALNANVIAPIIDASCLTVTLSHGILTIANSTANSAGGIAI